MLPISTAEKYRAVLNEHAEMENPPTFLFPCLNGRQQREAILFKEGLGKGDLAGTLVNFDGLFDKVESHLLGWENIDIEYSKDTLMDVISYMQCLELLAHLTYQSASIADKKKFKSPSPLSMASSVKPAQAEINASEPSATPTAGDSTE